MSSACARRSGAALSPVRWIPTPATSRWARRRSWSAATRTSPTYRCSRATARSDRSRERRSRTLSVAPWLAAAHRGEQRPRAPSGRPDRAAASARTRARPRRGGRAATDTSRTPTGSAGVNGAGELPGQHLVEVISDGELADADIELVVSALERPVRAQAQKPGGKVAWASRNWRSASRSFSATTSGSSMLAAAMPSGIGGTSSWNADRGRQPRPPRPSTSGAHSPAARRRAGPGRARSRRSGCR